MVAAVDTPYDGAQHDLRHGRAHERRRTAFNHQCSNYRQEGNIMATTAHRAATSDMPTTSIVPHGAASLGDAHVALRAETLRLTSEPDASARRAAVLYGIYTPITAH